MPLWGHHSWSYGDRSAGRSYGIGWSGATKYGRPHIEQANLSPSEVRSVTSCLVGGQDTFADCLYLVDPGVSRVSGLEYGGYQRIEALPGTKRAPSRNTSAAFSPS